MNAFPGFPSQLKWDAATLASAVPVRLRLHQLFAFDANTADTLPALANADPQARSRWQRSQYLRGAGTPSHFRIR